MQLGLRWDGEPCQCLLLELDTGRWDPEAAALEITDSQARSIRVNEVPRSCAAIRKDSGIVLAIQELAIVDEQTSSIAVAERCRLHLLELVQGAGIDLWEGSRRRLNASAVIELDIYRHFCGRLVLARAVCCGEAGYSQPNSTIILPLDLPQEMQPAGFACKAQRSALRLRRRIWSIVCVIDSKHVEYWYAPPKSQ